MACAFGSFHEDRLDDCITHDMRVIPEQRCDVVTLRSGKEERNLRWNRPRRRWDMSYGVRDMERFEIVRDFWYAREGRAHGFRGRDWSDYKTNPGAEITPFDELLVDLDTHEGSLVIDLYRHYGSGGRTKSIRVYKPDPCGLRIAVDGFEITTGWALDAARGRIEFDALPTGRCVTWGGYYDWPMRFEEDSFTIDNANATDGFAVNGLTIIEVLDERDIWPETEDDAIRAHLGSSDAKLAEFTAQVEDFGAFVGGLFA